MRIFSSLWIALVALFTASSASGQSADTIRITPGEKLPLIENVIAGESRYLRYLKTEDGKTQLIGLVRSAVSFEGEGRARVVRIRHDGDGPDISFGFDSVYRLGTLQPISHKRWRNWKSEEVEEEFAFTPQRVTGRFDKQGVMTPLDLATPTGVFNFEIDLETLSALPWAAGRTIIIPFYHPGGEPPADYNFIVEHEDAFMVGSTTIPAWVVTTDYNAPERGGATFWIAKDGGAVLRVEQPLPNGSTFVKALLVG